MKNTERLQALVGRRVEIDIEEPSYYAEAGTNRRSGRIRRALRFPARERGIWEVLVVELDQTLRWEDSTFRVVSLTRRFQKPTLYDLVSGQDVDVNINGEQEWLLDCPDDDPRILGSKGSRHLGFGGAQLTA